MYDFDYLWTSIQCTKQYLIYATLRIVNICSPSIAVTVIKGFSCILLHETIGKYGIRNAFYASLYGVFVINAC